MSEGVRVLVQFSATNLRAYIFDTEDLSVMRGASGELDGFVRAVRDAVANGSGACAGSRVVYAGASEILLETPDESSAQRVADEIERSLARELPFATGTAVVEGPKRGDALAARRKRLEARLRSEQLRRPTVIPARPGGARPCELDGIRPAEKMCRYKDGTRKWLSDHTARRYGEGLALRHGLLADLFPDDTGSWKQSFQDLEALNRAEPDLKPSVHGKMCVVQIDGNAFAACRARLTTLDGLASFAHVVEQAFRTALKRALDPAWREGARLAVLPVHLLYRAGDELCIVLPARFGVNALLEILAEFAPGALQALNGLNGAVVEQLRSAMNGGSLTLAAGVVFCDTHEPIGRAAGLAEALCESAKRTARRSPYDPDKGNVADVMIVESGFLPSNLSEHRDRMLFSAARNAPCTTRPFDRHALERLVRSVRTLKDAGFPNGRVHALARVVRQAGSPDELRRKCWEIFCRLPDPVTASLKATGLLPPNEAACTADSDHVRPWLDRREIWDYV